MSIFISGMSNEPDLKILYVCVCVCVYIYIYIKVESKNFFRIRSVPRSRALCMEGKFKTTKFDEKNKTFFRTFFQHSL